MDQVAIQALIETEFQKHMGTFAADRQFDIAKIPSHAHNGSDTSQLQFVGSLSDVPQSYFNAGWKPLMVNGGANAVIFPTTQTVIDAAIITPSATDNLVLITAVAQVFQLANPLGTSTDGRQLIIRIKDNGTARGMSFGSQYRALGNPLPSTTVLSKTLYLGVMYNAADTKFDLIAVSQEA